MPRLAVLSVLSAASSPCPDLNLIHYTFETTAAVLLGQWHSLSDPELEHSLITRIDFNLFCRFDELSIPDYSTLCRYRNWLAQDDTLFEWLKLINCQLAEKNLKVEKASAAVIDATIIQTAGSKQRQALEVDEEGQVSGQTTPSKDSDARWTKKNGLYKQSEFAKSSEGDMFEPFESRQQAKCTCCRLKGGQIPD